jgi:hypothetical protein
MQKVAARRPQKPNAVPLSNEEVGQRALAKVSELLEDPDWRARRRAAIAKARNKLTDEQVWEIRALKGHLSQVDVMRRYHIAGETVRKIWRGSDTDPPQAQR